MAFGKPIISTARVIHVGHLTFDKVNFRRNYVRSLHYVYPTTIKFKQNSLFVIDFRGSRAIHTKYNDIIIIGASDYNYSKEKLTYYYSVKLLYHHISRVSQLIECKPFISEIYFDYRFDTSFLVGTVAVFPGFFFSLKDRHSIEGSLLARDRHSERRDGETRRWIEASNNCLTSPLVLASSVALVLPPATASSTISSSSSFSSSLCSGGPLPPPPSAPDRDPRGKDSRTTHSRVSRQSFLSDKMFALFQEPIDAWQLTL